MSRRAQLPEMEDPRITRWLEERSLRLAPPDRGPVLKNTITSITTIRQRRRWGFLGWQSLGRVASRSGSSGASQLQRRDMSMSTVMKIIAGIAVVSIGTTVALTAALQPQGPPSPAVAGVTDPELLRPATISGTMARQPTMTEALEPIAWPAGSTSSGQHSEGDMIETDDPRFSGVVTLDLYSHIQLGMTRAGTFWGQQRVENEHGAWTGSVTGAGNPLGRMDMYSTLIGHGDYEGLYAIVYYAANGSMPAVVNGVILAGAPPPAS